jgi:hypothetical protein
MSAAYSGLARDEILTQKRIDALYYTLKQAVAFLAVRSLRGLPLTFPTTTGAPRPLSGGRLHLPA